MIVTNENTALEQIIQSTFSKTENAAFLVGYFYYSGFSLIYKKLEKVHLRVLVGLEAEGDMANHIIEIEHIDYYDEESRNSIKEKYYSHFCDIFNNTDFFDSSKAEAAFKMFCDKLQNGTLEIRKTEEPNHAKMYVFEFFDDDSITNSGTCPGSVIIGSSNLSRQGLHDRFEINNVSYEKADFIEGKVLFDELWTTAILIADTENWNEYKQKVLDKIWYEKVYSPFLLYLKVLDEYFRLDIFQKLRSPHEINNKYSNFKYQVDAVRMALTTIEKHNGVIIADVVGLGKSIIASTVASNLGLNTLIIVPPHLITQWQDYATEFKINARVFSSGKVSAALNYYNDNIYPDSPYLVIIDEAHRYRNENTEDYAMLHMLCAGNKIILLTATPFNNNPEDIYSMIKLFQIPSKSTLKTVTNLGAEFKSLIKEYRRLTKDQREKTVEPDELKIRIGEISKKIRGIITPLVVRRSRLDLEKITDYKKDLKRQHIEFPKVAEPEALSYSLGDIQQKYVDTLELISPDYPDKSMKHYKAARYQVINYVKKGMEDELRQKLEEESINYDLLIGTQTNLSTFMRRLLVRRFESSIYSFKSTLDNMVIYSVEILNWMQYRKKVPVYKKGHLPDPEDLFAAQGDDANDEINENFEMYKERGFFEIDLKYIRDDFRNDIYADMMLLEEIKANWFGKFDDGGDVLTSISLIDSKLSAFKEVIKKQIQAEKKRKLVVFSEFADTADYVAKNLSKEGLRVLKYSSDDSSEENKKRIRLNFDAGIKDTEQQNDYDILVATDAISEGYNLHRAGTIYNYDIPYNPTRVIQRIGRINRINKKVFDTLYIYNFFPSFVGETETRTKAISTLKMAMIQSIMGEDIKVLTPDEDLNSFFIEQYEKEKKLMDTESWETKHRQIWTEYLDTDLMRKARDIPFRTRIARKSDRNGVLIFGKKGNDYIFKYSFNGQVVTTIYPEDALELFSAQKSDKAVAVSDNFFSIYETIKKSLFKDEYRDDAQNRRKAYEAIDKYSHIQNIKNRDYYSDLKRIIQFDALTGYELRAINKMTQRDLAELPKKISQSYLNTIIHQANLADNGKEAIILSEELKENI